MFYNFITALLLSSASLAAIEKIDTLAQFLQGSLAVDNDRVTKFLVDVKTWHVDYFDVNRYPLHYDYYLTLENATHEGYLANYDVLKPEFIFGSLIHHGSQDLWTFALWEGDKATCEDIERAFKAVQASFYDGRELLFRPTSTKQEIEVAATSIPCITNDELYKKSSFQMLHRGKNVGTLRLGLDGAKEDDIVILSELVPDVAPVAGIILEHPSTPLSHLAMRARSWNIPHATIQDARALFRDFVGKRVFFEVTTSGYTLRLAEPHEETNAPSSKPVFIQMPDLTEKQIKPLQELNANAYGVKAGNLQQVARLGIPTGDGLAIPFYYYEEHMQNSGAYLEHDLEKRRQAILNYPLNPVLLKLFVPGVFVRSSTNCEDLPGFAAAGLYETVANVQDISCFEHAIKRVWASLWSDRAVIERSRFAIDEKLVSAAILLQKSLNATSSGVLVTKDIFDPTEFMEVFTINASFGLGINVVDGLLLPEQLLYNYDNKGIKVLSRAASPEIIVLSETGGTKSVPAPSLPYILSDDQVTKLGKAARILKRKFKTELDIEWLFVNEELYILQARPFQDGK